MTVCNDEHIERMFYDLTNGSWRNDPITMTNFRLYMREMWGCDYDPESFSDTDAMMRLLMLLTGNGDPGFDLGAEFADGETEGVPERFCVHIRSWPDKNLWTRSSRLSTAISLAIVQNMRYHAINTAKQRSLTH